MEAHQVTLVALGGSKAMHEFLVLHYLATDSAREYPSWIAGMKLMLDLLLGARKHRYLGRCLADPRPAEVYVRGFSAGSPSGICLLISCGTCSIFRWVSVTLLAQAPFGSRVR